MGHRAFPRVRIANLSSVMARVVVLFLLHVLFRPDRFWTGSLLYLEAVVCVDLELRVLLFRSVTVQPGDC